MRDTSKTPIPGGAIHPLTRYVMNYIKFLFDYTDILKQLIDEKKEAIPRQLSDGFIEFAKEDRQGDHSNTTPLARRLLSITSLLESNLEGKSKLYKDIALSHLFMMNNIRYIVQKVRGSELRTLLGDDWIRRHSGQVRQYAINKNKIVAHVLNFSVVSIDEDQIAANLVKNGPLSVGINAAFMHTYIGGVFLPIHFPQAYVGSRCAPGRIWFRRLCSHYLQGT